MTLAIGDTTVGLAYLWTSAQACAFISATILERGTTMMRLSRLRKLPQRRPKK